MATFLQGVTDEITPVQVYKPDYAFLTQVYGQRQAEYDRGFNMVKSLYSSALNNPLTSESNAMYRQEVFKKIQGSLKSVSGVDLSNPTNIMRAQELINPISKDQELAYDMQITAFHQKQKERMEAYKNSTDPKMRALYNDDSRVAIGLIEDDMRKTKRGDGSIKSIRPQEFVPQEDIAAFLNDAAKQQGIGITVAKADGKTPYIITATNGKMSYAAFTNWARTQMGNRFDRQLNQKGFVQAESTIRGVMQSQGMTREQALQTVSTQMASQLLKTTDDDTKTVDEELKKYDEQIALFKKNYPNGITDQKLRADYQKLLEERDAHKNELDQSTSLNGSLKTEGAAFVAKNIHSIFTQQAKSQMAQGWAQSYSDATAKIDIKEDQVVLTKWKMAHESSMQAARLKQERELTFAKMKQDQMNDDRKYALDIAKAQGEGKIASETYMGKNMEAGQSTGVAVLESSREGNTSSLFDKSFGAGNGLMNAITGAANHGKYYNVLSKVQRMSQGAGETLNNDEKAVLIEYANMVGTEIIDPNKGSAAAQTVLNGLIGGTYNKARDYVSYNAKQKKTKEVAAMLPVFNQVLGEMTTLMGQRENLESNYRKIAGIIGANGQVKAGFEGAKVVDYMADGTPIYDIEGLSVEKKMYLSTMVDDQYNRRANVSGDVIQFTGLNPGEIFAIADAAASKNSAAKIIVGDEDSKISPDKLAQLAPSDIKDLFGGSAQIAYDPQGQTVKVTMKVAPSSSTAKALGFKAGESMSVVMPYSYVQANPQALARLNSYIGKNSINSESMGALSVFASNPNARVTAPSTMEAVGFDYDITGVRDDQGRFALGMTFNYLNPETNQVESKYKLQPIADPSNPTSFMGANDIINQMYQTYITNKVAYEGQ